MKPRHFLWKLYAQTWAYWWGDALLTVLVYSLLTVPGVMSREFLDLLGKQGHSKFTLTEIVACIGIAALARIAAQLTGNLVDTLYRNRLSSPLREHMLAAIIDKLEPPTLSVGEALTRFRDDVGEVTGFLLNLCGAAGQLSFSIIALVVMSRIDISITVVTLLILLSVVGISRSAENGLRQYRIESREASVNITDFLAQTFSSIQAIQIAGAEENVCKHLESLNNKRRKRAVRESWYNSLLSSSSAQATMISTAAVVWLSRSHLQSGAFTVGEFALFTYFMGYLTGLPASIGSVIVSYSLATVSVDRLYAFLSSADFTDVVNRTPDHLSRMNLVARQQSFQHLDIRGVTYNYPNSGNGINEINAFVRKGEILAIVGVIGSGKTTFLKCLLGLLRPCAGDMRWNGEPTPYLGASADHRVAYAPQIGQLFSTSIKNNVLLGLREDLLEVLSIEQKAQLSADLQAMPDHWETLTGANGVRLSGGQKQRVIAARTLARDADVMLIDDLSTGLDSETEAALWRELFSDRDRTYIVASNRKDVLERADQIIVLKDGKVIAQGTRHHLLERYGSADWLANAI